MELLALLILLFCKGMYITVNASSSQKALMEHLMATYGHRSVRPVRNESDTINIQLRLLVAQVINFDERLQQLTINGWLKLAWRDDYLQWNPTEWNGTSSVSMSMNEIWKPDITFYENVDEKWESIKDIDAVASSDGYVVWLTPTILQVYCKVKVRYFPFDFQHCNITMASWRYDKSGINLTYTNDSDSKQDVYAENGVWKLYDNIYSITEVQYECCKHPYTMLVLELVLKRSPGFYITNIIVPCVLLSILTVFVFRLPPESGEKISLGMTNVLALILFQQLIAEDMPPLGDEMPVLGTYFLSMIAMGCFSVVITVIVLRVYHYPDSKPIPCWIQYLLTSMPCGPQKRSASAPTVSKLITGHNSTTKAVNPSHISNSGNLCSLLATSRGISLCTCSTVIDKSGLYVPPTSTILEGGDSDDARAGKQKTAVNWRNVAFLIDRLTFYVLLLGMTAVFLYVFIQYLKYVYNLEYPL